MNSSHYFSQLSSDLESLTSAVQGNSTVSVSGSVAVTNSNLTSLGSCVDGTTVVIDNRFINAESVAVGAGNLDTGTQRICIASDDNLTGTIAIQTGRVAGCVDLANNLLNIDNSRVSGNVIDVNSGTLSSGTQRMCIATDDVVSSNLVTLGGAVSSSKMNNNLSSVAGTTVSVNSGNKDAGCIRIVAATDDILLSKLNTLNNNQYTYTGGSTKSFTIHSRETSVARECAIGVGISRHDGVDTSNVGYNSFITAGSGNIADAPTYTGSGDNKDNYCCPRVCIATDDVNLAAIKSDLDTIKNILTDIWNSTNHYIRTHETA